MAAHRRFCLYLTCLLLALASSSSLAQATRTWVSGVGDDANPCSRTAPCKTFAGAISKTATGGVISVLDPGGYGAVNITKSITIEGNGTLGGILAAGTNGVIINAAGARVTLRDLLIEGAGSGLNGVRVLNAAQVVIENVRIEAFTQTGIDIAVNSGQDIQVSVQDSSIENLGVAGIRVTNGNSASSSRLQLDNVRIAAAGIGVHALTGSRVSARSTTVTGASQFAFLADCGAPGSITAEIILSGSAATFSDVGLSASNLGASIVMSDSTVSGNDVGLSTLRSGSILSFGDNRITGNTVNGQVTGTLVKQ